MSYLASIKPSKPLQSPKISVLGVAVDDISEEEAISRILTRAKDKQGQYFVATVNSEFVMLARRDPNFAQILKRTDLNVPDSIGVAVSKLILGGKVVNRVTGTDLLEKLCEKCAELPITVGFLGGFANVAEKVAKRQMSKFPGLSVVLFESGNPAIGYDLKLRKLINAQGRIDILFVAYGMGQQEFWIDRNRKFLNVGVFMGVGGAFNFEAGLKLRAPYTLRKIGLEWLWRLKIEPGRIWRMRVLPVFAILILGQFVRKMFDSLQD